jgi:membrane-associated protein
MHLLTLLNLLLHFDVELAQVIKAYGGWVYALLFAIMFAQNGLIVLPFLPGDSMLFVVGAFCAAGQLELAPALGLLWLGAVLGDLCNYGVGRAIGHRAFHWEHSRWFNRQAFDRAHAFYLRYGGVTIVAARFIPLVRTFAPFVAGVAEMPAAAFAAYNAGGGLLWVLALALAGYAFGNIPWVRGHIGLLSLAIVFISLLPLLVGWWRSRRRRG